MTTPAPLSGFNITIDSSSLNLRKAPKENRLSSEVHDRIRPVGSQRPRLYGLPKTHKVNVPLRPILSMIGSVQHKLAKWLTKVIDPVVEFYSLHCLNDSFAFAKLMRETSVNGSCVMCSKKQNDFSPTHEAAASKPKHQITPLDAFFYQNSAELLSARG